ncbi:MAG: outer membrane beta-barrel protein, partial [Pseudomonadota bacterium]
MRKSALLVAGASVLIAAPASAREGLYVGVDGGITLEDQVDVDADTTPPENAAFADTETGFDFDIVIGYDFGPVRIEAEGAYKQNSYDGLTVVLPAIVPGSPVPSGTVVENEEDLSIFSGMVNGIIDLGNDDGFNVFVGGGVGIANLDIPVEVAGVGTVVDDSTTDFAYQALAGLRFPVSDNLDLGLKYRYFVIDEFEIDTAAGIPAEVDYQAHSILASVVYNFGAKAAPP